MKTKRLAVAMGVALAICAGSADAAIGNGDFEVGLTGWTPVGGGATASTVNPDSGSQHANLTSSGSTATAANIESALGLAAGSLNAAISSAVGGTQDAKNGSAIWQDVSLAAGETVTFRWRFLDGESDVFFEDFVFVSLAGSPGVGPVVLAFANAGAGDTAYAGGSITAPVAGTYRLGFGEMNELDPDSCCDSTGRVDNVTTTGQAVPVPGTLALFGFGLFGIAALRRTIHT